MPNCAIQLFRVPVGDLLVQVNKLEFYSYPAQYSVKNEKMMGHKQRKAPA